MKLARREFIRLMAAGGLSLSFLTQNLAEVLAASPAEERQPLFWLQGHSAHIHQAGLFGQPDLAPFLTKYFRTFSYEHVQDFLEEIKEEKSEKPPILVLEGYFPQGRQSPHDKLLTNLCQASQTIVLLGNEAAYGTDAPEGFIDLETEYLNKTNVPFIKLPGMPANGNHLLGTLNHLILYGLPEIDEFRRPMMFFSNRICDRCQYRSDFEKGNFVEHYGQKEGCLYLLGCKGRVTHNSCPVDKWNGTNSWCVSVGSPCTGCSEPEFPLHSGMGMFGRLSDEKAGVNSGWIRNLDRIALGAAAVTVSGIALHALSKKTDYPSAIESSIIMDEEDE